MIVFPELELATIQKWFDKSANICLALSTEMHSICQFSFNKLPPSKVYMSFS